MKSALIALLALASVNASAGEYCDSYRVANEKISEYLKSKNVPSFKLSPATSIEVDDFGHQIQVTPFVYVLNGFDLLQFVKVNLDPCRAQLTGGYSLKQMDME